MNVCYKNSIASEKWYKIKTTNQMPVIDQNQSNFKQSKSKKKMLSVI